MVHSEQAPAPMPLANVPTAHSVQVLAPGLPPMFVTDPVAHVVHASMFDAAEYSPATHAVQLVAPVEVPVSVTEPAWHGKQNDLPLALW